MCALANCGAAPISRLCLEQEAVASLLPMAAIPGRDQPSQGSSGVFGAEQSLAPGLD